RVSCGVVTQVVKAKLGGRAVGDIGLVAFLPQRGPPVYEALVLQVPARIDIAGVVDGGFLLLADHGGAQAQQVVDRAHPATVTAGEVVVDRDEVDATPGQRIEVHRQGGDERLTFARLHLRDLALVQDDTADKLYVIMSQARRPHGCLTHGGEGFRQ